jgi:pimeloyl-ACP methyl ester carboxylesterase
MHVARLGTGPRKLLVIPGWRLDGGAEEPDWREVLVARPCWTAHLVDLPGTGDSRGEQAGIASQRDLLSALIEFVVESDADGSGWAVAGTSNGAALALGVARRRPDLVRGLALRVPMLEPDDEVRAQEGRVSWQRAFDALPATYRALYEAKEREVWEPARARTDAEFLAAIRQDPARYALPEALDVPTFGGPALVVLGRQDARVGFKRALEHLLELPRATVAVLDRAGHALPAGSVQDGLWAALAVDWLDRVEDVWPIVRVRRRP